MCPPTRMVKEPPAGKSKLRLTRRRVLGKYQLEKRLGIGGYCEVWKARDRVEDIWVALKIPQADVNGKRDNQTILREVRLVAQLRHPHIMPVKNAEIIDGHAILATELSVGTLDDKSRPMGVRKIMSIVIQVLQGLAYAHDHRMVHCDVTPGNIFLFPNGRAALGDFGISFHLKGRMKTVDDYGTPGYVAPEQAYGRPTYRSDCFAVGLVLYEYLTGRLPRWPFKWPMPQEQRLRQRTNVEFVKFIKKALSVDPAKRFANAQKMLTAMHQAMPRALKTALALPSAGEKKLDWRQLRRQTYTKRYSKIFPLLYLCVDCGEPVAEAMRICPWCSSTKNRYDDCTQLTHICSRCHKGILGEWRYCPWCYGSGFEPQIPEKRLNIAHHAHCSHCSGKITRFMRYCPWCRRKHQKPWRVWPFPEICGKCGWSVDTNYWNYCPWCKQSLI